MPKPDNQLYLYLKDNPDSLSTSEKLRHCITSSHYEITTVRGSKILIFTLLDHLVFRVNTLLQQNTDEHVKNLKVQATKETHLSIPDSMDFPSPKNRLSTQFHVTLACYDERRRQNFKFTLYFNLDGMLLETNFSVNKGSSRSYAINASILKKFTDAILEVTEFHNFISGLDEMLHLSDTPFVHSESHSARTPSAAASSKSASSTKKASTVVDTEDATKSAAIATSLEQCQELLQDIIANPEINVISLFKQKFPRKAQDSSDDLQRFADMFFVADADQDPSDRLTMVTLLLADNDDTIIYAIQTKIMELYTVSVANDRMRISEYGAVLEELIENFIQEKHATAPAAAASSTNVVGDDGDEILFKPKKPTP